jgi:hypothetical protein
VLITPIPGLWHLIVMVAYGAGAVLAVLLIAGSRTWQERLFRYEGGIAQFASREPEPAVLRWADLASLSLIIVDRAGLSLGLDLGPLVGGEVVLSGDGCPVRGERLLVIGRRVIWAEAGLVVGVLLHLL